MPDSVLSTYIVMEERLVIAGLELIRDNQETIGIVLDLLLVLVAGEAVERSFGYLVTAVLVLARKRDDGLIGTLALLEISLKGVEVLYGSVNAVCHDHGSRCPADLAMRNDLAEEVVDHHLCLLTDRVLMGFNIAAQLFLRPLGVERRIVLHRLHESVVALNWGIVLQHV